MSSVVAWPETELYPYCVRLLANAAGTFPTTWNCAMLKVAPGGTFVGGAPAKVSERETAWFPTGVVAVQAKLSATGVAELG